MEITQFENDLLKIKNLVHSVKSMNTSNQNIISQLKTEEAENNKVALNYAKGIVDSVMFIQEHIVPELSLEDLDIKYDLTVSQNIQNNIIIEGSYNSDFILNDEGSRKYTRTGFFDHFSYINVGEAIARLNNLFQECHRTYTDNIKNK